MPRAFVKKGMMVAGAYPKCSHEVEPFKWILCSFERLIIVGMKSGLPWFEDEKMNELKQKNTR